VAGRGRKYILDRPAPDLTVAPPAGLRDERGGRVTELLARPLLNLFWPDLAGFVQPLAGEAAGRRELLARVPFVSDYGVEIAMLVNLLGLAGLDALAQVDLGERAHRNQSNEALGQMSAQILLTAWSRLARQGRADAGTPLPTLLTQSRRGGDQPLPNLPGLVFSGTGTVTDATQGRDEAAVSCVRPGPFGGK